jgi:predicted amidohydrolase YtcJ
MTRLRSLFAITLLLLTCLPALPERFAKVDLLLLNARVVTMNPKQPGAEAIAISGGRILWVGNNGEAKKLFPVATETIDLGGATVLPGIIDAHTHLMSLGESFLKLNLKDVATEQEAVELVRQRAATAATGEWILGWGWDEGKWAAHYPTHHALSEAAPNNPVFLVGLHSFAAWANKRALEIAGVVKDTKDPDSGKIARDGAGEPTGILMGRAQELVARHIPPLTLDQVKRAIELAAAQCLRHGLTSVHEARVTPIMIQALRELVKEGRLPLRVYVMLDGADRALVDEWLLRGPEVDQSHQLTIRSIKLFADGALGSRGARLFEPYSDAMQTSGSITTTEADIYSLTRRALEKGFQVATHAIGDAANHFVLDAYEKALKETRQARDARLRVEHAQVLAAADIPRFARLGVIASMQPTHCTSDMVWAEKRVGPARIKGAYAWRSVLNTGAHLAVSSDFPGETLNPFYGIYAAVTRQDPEGNPKGGWRAEQKMTLAEALRGYTVEAAYAEFEERAKGSLDRGKLADLIVISKDITKIDPKEMLTIRVLKSLVGGKIVYDAGRSN